MSNRSLATKDVLFIVFRTRRKKKNCGTSREDLFLQKMDVSMSQRIERRAKRACSVDRLLLTFELIDFLLDSSLVSLEFLETFLRRIAGLLLTRRLLLLSSLLISRSTTCTCSCTRFAMFSFVFGSLFSFLHWKTVTPVPDFGVIQTRILLRNDEPNVSLQPFLSFRRHLGLP